MTLPDSDDRNCIVAQRSALSTHPQEEGVPHVRIASGKEGNMKQLSRIGMLAAIGVVVLSGAPAMAFDCPNMHKAVMAYYDKTAKVSGVDQAKLTQAKTTLDEAMKKHEAGDHRGSMDGMADAMKQITAARP